ncbi:MAG: hypothetical protein L0170_16695, partial [Acidobacteria bacterium]|nr:hypothetical protein [Acidobacteriota bacterium]
MRIGIRTLTVVPWVLCAAVAPGLPATGTEDVKVQIRREAVLSLLTAAMPYKVEVGASLLKESLTFTDPRDLSFAEGKVTFAVRCQGSPFPVDQVIHPVFTFKRGASGYQLVVDSLPVGIPGFGRVDLKDLFPPVELQALLRGPLQFRQGRRARAVRQVGDRPARRA